MGGLTVVKALTALLPDEGLVYLGDTARLPYGSKSPETVRRYAVQCARALMRYDIKMLVVACNTASATALADLSQVLAPTPVIGVIQPGAEAAVAAAPAGRIAVLATEGTVKGRRLCAGDPRAKSYGAGDTEGLPAVRAAGGRRRDRGQDSRTGGGSLSRADLLADQTKPARMPGAGLHAFSRCCGT